MSTDLTIILEDRPGTLADLGEALGGAGVNIDAMCGFPCEGKGLIHVLVEDAAAAKIALEKSGLEVLNERQVLVLELEDKPGIFGDVCRRIANAGVNTDLSYIASNNRIVIGVDDLEKARAAV